MSFAKVNKEGAVEKKRTEDDSEPVIWPMKLIAPIREWHLRLKKKGFWRIGKKVQRPFFNLYFFFFSSFCHFLILFGAR